MSKIVDVLEKIRIQGVIDEYKEFIFGDVVINNDLTVDIKGDVHFEMINEKTIPDIKIRNITGELFINCCDYESLVNFPQNVEGNITIRNCPKLKSIDDLPAFNLSNRDSKLILDNRLFTKKKIQVLGNKGYNKVYAFKKYLFDKDGHLVYPVVNIMKDENGVFIAETVATERLHE